MVPRRPNSVRRAREETRKSVEKAGLLGVSHLLRRRGDDIAPSPGGRSHCQIRPPLSAGRAAQRRRRRPRRRRRRWPAEAVRLAWPCRSGEQGSPQMRRCSFPGLGRAGFRYCCCFFFFYVLATFDPPARKGRENRVVTSHVSPPVQVGQRDRTFPPVMPPPPVTAGSPRGRSPQAPDPCAADRDLGLFDPVPGSTGEAEGQSRIYIDAAFPRRAAVGPNETARRPPNHLSMLFVAPVGLVPPPGLSIDEPPLRPAKRPLSGRGGLSSPSNAISVAPVGLVSPSGLSIDAASRLRSPLGQTRPPAAAGPSIDCEFRIQAPPYRRREAAPSPHAEGRAAVARAAIRARRILKARGRIQTACVCRPLLRAGPPRRALVCRQCVCGALGPRLSRAARFCGCVVWWRFMVLPPRAPIRAAFLRAARPVARPEAGSARAARGPVATRRPMVLCAMRL